MRQVGAPIWLWRSVAFRSDAGGELRRFKRSSPRRDAIELAEFNCAISLRAEYAARWPLPAPVAVFGTAGPDTAAYRVKSEAQLHISLGRVEVMPSHAELGTKLLMTPTQGREVS